MVKVVCLFNQVEEPRELDSVIYDELVPLLKEMIGVTRLEITDFKLNPVATPQKKDTLPMFAFMIELYFRDVRTYEAALKDQSGQKVFNHLLGVCEEIIEVGLGNSQLISMEND